MISNYINFIEPNIDIYDNDRVAKAFYKRQKKTERSEKELWELLVD
jgi:hypothetical protein